MKRFVILLKAFLMIGNFFKLVHIVKRENRIAFQIFILILV